MLRIAGINLPTDKRLAIALMGVYGIGRSLGRQICKMANLSENKKAADLTNQEVEILRKIVAKFLTEGDLRRQIQQNKKLLQDIGSYRGSRHQKGLPCRGQRTSNNARTNRKRKSRAIGFGNKNPGKK